jgi:hypothetical protein
MAKDFPEDIKITAAEWYLNSNTQSHKSPLSGVTQTLGLPGAYWSAVLSFENQEPAAARKLEAFLIGRRGQAVNFSLYDHAHPTPRGQATGTPLVYGSEQTGSQLITEGWTANVTGILKAGDYIQVGSRLKMVVADANSDALGRSTLQTEPPWRLSPTDGASIITDHPTALMRLADNKSGFSTKPPYLSSGTISCVEDMADLYRAELIITESGQQLTTEDGTYLIVEQ